MNNTTATKKDLILIDEIYINSIIEDKTNNYIKEWGTLENPETEETLKTQYFISLISFSDMFEKCESFRFVKKELYNIPRGWTISKVETEYFYGFALIKPKSSSV